MNKYGHAWPRFRKRKIESCPFCERCLQRGIQTLAVEVHHILPVNQGGTNDKENLMSVCSECHKLIHIELGDRKEYKED